MASPQEKGDHDGQRAAGHLKGGVHGIFAATEELRTGINSFLDNTLQPSAHRDAQAGVTARHRDDGSHAVTDTADMGHHHHDAPPVSSPSTTATTTGTTGTTDTTTTSYPPPPLPPRDEDIATAASTTTTPTTAPTTTTTTTADAAAPAPASSEYGLKHTGFSGDAKKLGDSIKNSFHNLKKH